MKETLTDKLMKRFYGITGPLDEYRKQEINRIGNLSFIYLFYTILFANVIAIIISKKVSRYSHLGLSIIYYGSPFPHLLCRLSYQQF